MAQEEKLDRTAFASQTFKEADDTLAFWLRKSPGERLRAGYILSLRVFGFDPENEPRLDRSKFSMRKQG